MKWEKSIGEYRKSATRARLTETVKECGVTMPSQELEYLSRYLPFVKGDGATTPDLFKLTNTAFSNAGLAEAADEDEWKQDFADMATKVASMEDFSDDDSEDEANPVSEPARGRSRG